MSCGIKISNSSDVSIVNCFFGGLDIGIDAQHTNNIKISGSHFKNVKTGVKLNKVNGLTATKNTETNSLNGYFKLSLVSIAINNILNLRRIN
ncbi:MULTISPECIES: hypothetical protein [Proteus]|uniref:hypothetical protein n=1 Tax=Proteus TaxID=583 RepID=UPI002575E7C9|nr:MULTISPECIES: hypothetical protein [Proteus]MDM3684814.1 hypothetical protein [Proteus mirabilis]